MEQDIVEQQNKMENSSWAWWEQPVIAYSLDAYRGQSAQVIFHILGNC